MRGMHVHCKGAKQQTWFGGGGMVVSWGGWHGLLDNTFSILPLERQHRQAWQDRDLVSRQPLDTLFSKLSACTSHLNVFCPFHLPLPEFSPLLLLYHFVYSLFLPSFTKVTSMPSSFVAATRIFLPSTYPPF